MTARAYIIRLVWVLVIFLALIPGVVIALLFGMEHTPGNRNSALGFAYVAFFIGIPIWALSFLITLSRTAYVRARALGLPFWIGLTLIVFLIADWRSIYDVSLLLRYPLPLAYGYVPPFFTAAIALLVALAIWPPRAADQQASRTELMSAQDAAVWSWGIQALLGCASVAASVSWFWTISPVAAEIQRQAQWAGRWWLLAICGAMIWAMVESQRRPASA
jgi:hypothetical protein